MNDLRTLSRGKYGRRGLPADFKAQMLADYYELRSIEKVATKYGRTRQAMWEILKTAGCKFYLKNPLVSIMYKGRKFTPGKGGYFRSTDRRKTGPGVEVQLHRQVWVDHNGLIPPGHDIGFKDGNMANVDIANLFCLSHAQMASVNATGENGHTKSARERLQLLTVHFNQGESSLASKLKKEAA